VGRRQLEPIGVMIFSVVMILSFSQVLIESVKQLINPASHDIVSLAPTAVYIMLGTLVSKIAAWALCRHVNNSSIQALVEDAKTDVVFNTFSLIFPLIGILFHIWWIDAAGASALCLFVIIQWISVTFEHINHLSGSHASKEEYQQVLYLVMRFTDEVAKVKNYRMYHMGDLVNVEVDIVLRNSHMRMKDAHDLGESLQYSIETLPYVSRCFVHMDYKVRNYTGHIG
jgi:divalent metal cation (Fe/Co/Zn/Cd) transporter